MKKFIIGLVLALVSILPTQAQQQEVIKLPYVTAPMKGNVGYWVFMVNPTKSEMDCLIHPLNSPFPTFVNLKPMKVGEPVSVKGLDTKFKYGCKEVIRT